MVEGFYRKSGLQVRNRLSSHPTIGTTLPPIPFFKDQRRHPVASCALHTGRVEHFSAQSKYPIKCIIHNFESRPKTSRHNYHSSKMFNTAAFGAIQHVTEARQLALTGDYMSAFEHYLTAIMTAPEMATRLEPEFRRFLERYNDYLGSIQRAGEIFVNFERAMNAYPSNVSILSDLGRYLFKYGFLRESCIQYQKALSLDSGFVTAEKNLNSVKNFMVERWHFRMLNDRIRNSAYREALKEVIRPMKETILDLGTGTGLLALYAYQCSPMMVTACDNSETMIDIAGNVLKEADIDDIILVHKRSTNMNYKDIYGKRSLIIFELFDAGLLGENCLQTLVHAQQFLTSVNGKFLPARAEMFVVGVQSAFLGCKYRMGLNAIQLLGLSGQSVHLVRDEPYDSEDIPDIKDATVVTHKESVFKIDFNSLKDMKDKLEGNNIYEVTLKATCEARVDCIIGFFKLHLTDNVAITTDPMAKDRANAWQQAIFYDFEPPILDKNSTIPLQFTTDGGKLNLLSQTSTNILRASSDVIRFVNDEEFIKEISDCIGAVCIYLCQINEVSRINVLDFCPFPVFGLMMMRRGVENLTCYAKTPTDKNFIISVLEANNVPLHKVKIIMDNELETDFYKDLKFHVIFMNMIELSGDVNSKCKFIMKQLKQKCLLSGGLALPHKIILESQLVSCPRLEHINRVDDSNIVTCSVAKFINKYQVSQNFHIDICHLDYKPLSKVVAVANFCETILPEVINVEIVESGHVNAVLCWYKVQLIESGDFVSTQRAKSFVDCMCFLADPKVTVSEGGTGNLILCVDNDECFKIIVDVDDDDHE